MKNLISLAILIAFSSVSFAKEVIRHIHWTQPPYDEIIMGTAKDFMSENPNVEIKIQLVADADMPTKVRTALTANGVETFAMPNMQSPWFMANGTTAEIIPSAFGKNSIQEVVDMWLPGAIKKTGGFYEGKYYGIPHEMSNYAAWVNIDHMKNVGLDPKKDIPTTWQEFKLLGKILTEKNGDQITRNGFAINTKAAIFPFLILHSLMQQKGLDWSSEKGLYSSLDSKEALEAFSTFTNWATKDGIFDPGLFENEREGFGNGLTSQFLTGGTWYWGVLDGYSVKRDEVMPIKYPRFKDGKNIGGVAYGYCVFVSKQAKNKELAWKWLNYLENRPEKYIVHGWFQPRKSLDKKLAAKYIPNYEVFGEEFEYAAAIIASAKFAEIQDAVGASVQRVLFEDISNEESLSMLKDDVGSILDM
jgi:ABC-type glycerol-3-phosphate transport system substrate-binding protein